VPGTRVTLADGTTTAVENLKAGAALFSWDAAGKPSPVKVTAVRRLHADSYLLIRSGEAELQATGAHRLMLADGSLGRFDTLKPGALVRLAGPGGPTAAAAVRLYPANLIAYDLTTEGHRPFLAGGYVVGD